jgi:CMP-N,N'-diacetyllegionaminic acid synthase
MKMRVLSIIPARGGSKGIPFKNIHKLCGKPLISYSIKNALESKLINRVIVSTDDKKIAKISKYYGAEVPFLRPKNLAKDSTSTLDVIKYLLDELNYKEKYIPDIITILQPTTPLRTTISLDKSIRLLIRYKPNIVLGVFQPKSHPYRSFWKNSKFLTPLRKDFLKFHQRQLRPDCYYPSGSIYTFWNKTIEQYGDMYGPKILPLILNKKESIDIDDPFDLLIANTLLKNKT